MYHCIQFYIQAPMLRTIDEIVRDYFALVKIDKEIIKFGPMLTSGVYPVLVRNQDDAVTRRFKFRRQDLTVLGYNNELIIDRAGMHMRFE